MKYFLIILIPVLFVLFSFMGKGPEALFAGKRNGNIDRLTFLGTKALELKKNTNDQWKITGYEFDFSCGGKMFMKYYNCDTVTPEIRDMIKNCSDPIAVVDFTNIKVRSYTGVEKTINPVRLNLIP